MKPDYYQEDTQSREKGLVACSTVLNQLKRENSVGFWVLTAIKYLWRYMRKKDPIGDLEKARECIEKEIELLKVDWQVSNG